MTAVLNDERRSDIPRAELYSFLQDYPEHMLWCRGYGHDFKPIRRGGYRETYIQEERQHVLEKPIPCAHGCGVTRFDRLYWVRDRWRELPREDMSGRNYDYPEGYLLPEGWYISRIEVREYLAWRDYVQVQ